MKEAPISLGCDEFAMGLRMDLPNRRELFSWYHKVLACIANSSRTVRQSFKHVILFCATKVFAKPSLSHRICREPVDDPSLTLPRRSPTHLNEVSEICTMRQICDIRPFRKLRGIKLIKDIRSHDCCVTVTRMSQDCRTLVRQSHECLTTVLR